MSSEDYVIRGGVEGRERLRILSRVLQPFTLRLFDQVGIQPGMSCLDLGCGGGDVTFDLATVVGPSGNVLGIDMDATKIELAKKEAAERNLSNVEFRTQNILESQIEGAFDAVYTRFLLTHLSNPVEILGAIKEYLKPGGLIIVEDIDFRGHFSFPVNEAFNDYVQLYSQVSIESGGDPFIGPKLPGMLTDIGFEKIQMNVVQPAGIKGEVKLIAAITMENIADAILIAGLSSPEEIKSIVEELYAIANDATTVVSMPRIVQVWSKLRKN